MPGLPWSSRSCGLRTSPTSRTLRATISPDNEASLALIRQYPFVHNGEQWDEEDGLELIYELAV